MEGEPHGIKVAALQWAAKQTVPVLLCSSLLLYMGYGEMVIKPKRESEAQATLERLAEKHAEEVVGVALKAATALKEMHMDCMAERAEMRKDFEKERTELRQRN